MLFLSQTGVADFFVLFVRGFPSPQSHGASSDAMERPGGDHDMTHRR